MKKILVVALAVILFTANLSFADEPLDKLKRGALNIVMSPREIVHGIAQAKEHGKSSGFFRRADGWDSALTWGVLNGLLRMTGRALVGVFEVVTCPFPAPPDYKPILSDPSDPEFFL